jgi:sirohydrochlorin cobaltochelatase
MRAVLLVAHGSPDPDWRKPFDGVVADVASRTEHPVRLVFLERQAPSLIDGVDELAALGATTIDVFAILLSGGGRHMKVDIPELMAAAKAQHPRVTLTLHPHAMGVHPWVLAAMANAVLASIDQAEDVEGTDPTNGFGAGGSGAG